MRRLKKYSPPLVGKAALQKQMYCPHMPPHDGQYVRTTASHRFRYRGKTYEFRTCCAACARIISRRPGRYIRHGSSCVSPRGSLCLENLHTGRIVQYAHLVDRPRRQGGGGRAGGGKAPRWGQTQRAARLSSSRDLYARPRNAFRSTVCLPPRGYTGKLPDVLASYTNDYNADDFIEHVNDMLQGNPTAYAAAHDYRITVFSAALASALSMHQTRSVAEKVKMLKAEIPDSLRMLIPGILEEFNDASDEKQREELERAIDHLIKMASELYGINISPRAGLEETYCGPTYLYSGQSASRQSIRNLSALQDLPTGGVWNLETFMSSSVCKSVAENFAGEAASGLLIRLIVPKDKYDVFPYVPLFKSDIKDHCSPRHPYRETEVLLPPYLQFEKTQDIPRTTTMPRQIDLTFKGIARDRPTQEQFADRIRGAIYEALQLYPLAPGSRRGGGLRPSKTRSRCRRRIGRSCTKKRHRHTTMRRR